MSVLIATPMKNCAEELPAYFAALSSLSYPRNQTSLAILESDSTDDTVSLVLDFIKAAGSRFKQIVFTRKPAGFRAPTDRHAYNVQYERRKVLARARNDLLSSVNLSDFDYVLWLDADSTGYQPSLIQDLISVNRSIVAPHVVNTIGGHCFDHNSWWETQPDKVWREPLGPVMFEGYVGLQDEEVGHRLYMRHFRQIMDSDPFQIVPLHGVGTAVLLVEAKVHAAGINFPVEPYKRRIESEGFGLWANDAGYSAWGLPRYEVAHINAFDLAKERAQEGQTWSMTYIIPLIGILACLCFYFKIHRRFLNYVKL